MPIALLESIALRPSRWILFLLPFIVFIVLLVWFIPAAEKEGTVTYDSEAGSFTITFSEPLPDAAWTMDVSYEDGRDVRSILSGATITLSSDKRTVTIVNEKLINLHDGVYDLDVTSPTQEAHHLRFQVTDHVDSSDDTWRMVVAILFFVVVGGFLIARRIIFGKSAGWSWSKRI